MFSCFDVVLILVALEFVLGWRIFVFVFLNEPISPLSDVSSTQVVVLESD